VSYGTKIPATGTLVWFSPTMRAGPSIVEGQSSGHGEINLEGAKLNLERRGDDWLISPR
jgi:hypothetical protein